MKGIVDKYIDAFSRRRDLAVDDAEALLDALISESDEALLAKLFVAWHAKGLTEDEIYSIARIMRDRCSKVRSRHTVFADIVGTGGSLAKTFNVSTAAAFVVAGGGVPVAKHGNRAATSSSGSADVLAELGVATDVDPATAAKNLDELGICFMFAPNFHRLSPTLGKVRRGLGFPTVFNCVGPLCNPAGAPHQLIGVWNADLLPKMGRALARLGTRKSWIVHGEGGLDELTLAGTTRVVEVADGKVTAFDFDARHNGLDGPLDGISASLSASESAGLIRRVLAGEMRDSAAEKLVTLNAMAVFQICNTANDLDDARAMAVESVRSGAARRKLEALAAGVAV